MDTLCKGSKPYFLFFPHKQWQERIHRKCFFMAQTNFYLSFQMLKLTLAGRSLSKLVLAHSKNSWHEIFNQLTTFTQLIQWLLTALTEMIGLNTKCFDSKSVLLVTDLNVNDSHQNLDFSIELALPAAHFTWYNVTPNDTKWHSESVCHVTFLKGTHSVTP